MDDRDSEQERQREKIPVDDALVLFFVFLIRSSIAVVVAFSRAVVIVAASPDGPVDDAIQSPTLLANCDLGNHPTDSPPRGHSPVPPRYPDTTPQRSLPSAAAATRIQSNVVSTEPDSNAANQPAPVPTLANRPASDRTTQPTHSADHTIDRPSHRFDAAFRQDNARSPLVPKTEYVSVLASRPQGTNMAKSNNSNSIWRAVSGWYVVYRGRIVGLFDNWYVPKRPSICSPEN